MDNEGLLEYTVRRMPNLAVGLTGSQKVRNPIISLAELESLHGQGADFLTDHLVEATSRSTSAIRNALARETKEDDLRSLVQAPLYLAAHEENEVQIIHQMTRLVQSIIAAPLTVL